MTANELVPALINALNQTGLIRVLLAQNGSWVINDTSAHANISAYSIVVSSEAVIAECLVTDSNSDTTDYVSTRNWGVTLSAGSLLRVPMNSTITSITLTSGTIIYY